MQDMNFYADSMINQINQCVENNLKNYPIIRAAIVKFVNSDGTLDVYVPPNDQTIFTRIPNQTSFSFQEGDSVELLLKDGTYNNCWVTAKHGAVSQETKNRIQKINDLEFAIDQTDDRISNLPYENWTFTFEDGNTITKQVVLKSAPDGPGEFDPGSGGFWTYNETLNSISAEYPLLLQDGRIYATESQTFPSISIKENGNGAAFFGYAQTDGALEVYGKEIAKSTGAVFTAESSTSGTEAFYSAKRTDVGRHIAFGVGSGGDNSGIYDWNSSSWMLYKKKNEADTRVAGGMILENGALTTPQGVLETMNTDSSIWKPGIQWKNPTDVTSGYRAGIGWHNTGGDGTGVITIIPYNGQTRPWERTAGLSISKSDIKFEGNLILGNHDSYVGKEETNSATVTVPNSSWVTGTSLLLGTGTWIVRGWASFTSGIGTGDRIIQVASSNYWSGDGYSHSKRSNAGQPDRFDVIRTYRVTGTNERLYCFVWQSSGSSMSVPTRMWAVRIA